MQVVWGTATSCVCAYSDRWHQVQVRHHWLVACVRNTLCGQNKGGYAQIVNGVGDWTALLGMATSTARHAAELGWMCQSPSEIPVCEGTVTELETLWNDQMG